MAKPELGVKRACPNCGAKYYDLNRDPIVCPKCGTVFEERHPTTSYRSARPETAAEEEEEVATDEDEAAGDVEFVSLEDADENEGAESKPPAFPEDDGSDDIDGFDKDDLVEDDLMDEGEDEVDGIIEGAVENDDEER